MGIAHRAVVGAALNHTAGLTHNAAGIRAAVQQVVGLVVGDNPLLQRGGVYLLQVQVVLRPGQVDSGAVHTGQNQAQIASGNAAGGALTADRAGGGTPDNLSSGAVAPGDAAHCALSLYRAGKDTVFQRAGVVPHNAAYNRAGAAGDHSPLDGEIAHGGSGLDIAEQSHGGAGAGEPQAGDGVSLSVEDPGNGGDGGEVHPGQVQVGGENRRFALGPGIQGTVF